jgi:hypothetical protein
MVLFIHRRAGVRADIETPRACLSHHEKFNLRDVALNCPPRSREYTFSTQECTRKGSTMISRDGQTALTAVLVAAVVLRDQSDLQLSRSGCARSGKSDSGPPPIHEGQCATDGDHQ